MHRCALRPLIVVLLVALPASACGGSVPGASGPAPSSTGPVSSPGAAATEPTAAPGSPATTPPPATTIYAPSAPQPSASAAAAALVSAWQRGNRQAAATLAAPAAVDALFAFPGRILQPRGCSDGQPPLSCSFADRSTAGHFYVVDADQAGPGRWYVTAVQVS